MGGKELKINPPPPLRGLRARGALGEEEEEGEEGQEEGDGGGGRAGGGGVAAVGSVGADAGGVSHGVGDVVLLVDPVEEVGHGAAGENRHVFAAVGLLAQRHGRLGLVVGVRWGERGRGEKRPKFRIIPPPSKKITRFNQAAALPGGFAPEKNAHRNPRRRRFLVRPPRFYSRGRCRRGWR